MTTDTQLQLPALGWRIAFAPCSECWGIIERESKTLIYAGQQQDCYECRNRMTVTRIADDGLSRTEMLSAFEREADQPREWSIASLAFNDLFTRSITANWISRHGLEGFPTEPTETAMEWSVFKKAESTEDSVLTPLGDGVVALCILIDSK